MEISSRDPDRKKRNITLPNTRQAQAAIIRTGNIARTARRARANLTLVNTATGARSNNVHEPFPYPF
jgi:hypothetical protein